jgi:hypothetical protein
VSTYWVSLGYYMALSKEQLDEFEDSLKSRGMRLGIALDSSWAPSESQLDSEYEKDLNEEAEAQGVDVKSGRAGLQDDVSDLLTPRRQSGGGL